MKNDYYIKDGIAYVTLTQGQVCRVDEADLPLIEKYRWWCAFNSDNAKEGTVVWKGQKVLGDKSIIPHGQGPAAPASSSVGDRLSGTCFLGTTILLL